MSFFVTDDELAKIAAASFKKRGLSDFYWQEKT
jgi:hypothetical protein